MYTPRFILSLVAASAIAATSAQSYSTEVIAVDLEAQMLAEIIDDTQVLYYGNSQATDSSKYRDLLYQFYEDQFRHSQDPRAPYFMLMSRNGNIAMGIGGDLKMMGAYDWHGAIDGTGFVTYDIPIPESPTAHDLFQMTPSRTGLFFSVFGKDKRLGNFQVYIQGRFNGPNNSFKLGKAYAIVGDWTFGYTKSTFSDPIAQPSTVDTQGPNSENSETRVLARYMHALDKKWTVALSAENPTAGVPTGAKFEPINDYMPEFAAFLQYAYHKQHIRLAGIVRSMGYRDLVENTNHHVAGWGVNLSAKIYPTPWFAIMASANTGQGIGSLTNDLSQGDLDLLGVASEPGKMYAPRSFGYYGALQYYFTPRVFSTLVFSQERMLPKDAVYPGSSYKYGLYGAANVFWNIAPRVQVGAEFNVGKRCNMDGSSHVLYRGAVSAQFSF